MSESLRDRVVPSIAEEGGTKRAASDAKNDPGSQGKRGWFLGLIFSYSSRHACPNWPPLFIVRLFI